MRGEEESRPALALTFIFGHVAVLTAPLPFARDSDGGCSNRAAIHNRVGRGWELLGDASRGSSTGNRIYRPVSSLLAYVQQEGSYELRRGRSGPGRRRIRAVVVDS